MGCIGPVALAGISSNGYAADHEGLQIELQPYVWATGIDGKITARGQTVNFDKSFSDLVNNVDMGFMFSGALSYNRFVAYADYNYISLSDKAHAKGIGGFIPPGTKLTADINTDITTFAGGYRFDTFGENWVDVLFGARTISLDESLKALNTGHVSNNSSITDTIVMLRPSFRISDHWTLRPTFSYAISGDSDTAYGLEPNIRYRFSDSFAVGFGYKKLYYKESNGSGANKQGFDGNLSGLTLGVGWTFPTRHHEVAEAPAPAEMAAPEAVPAAPLQ